MHANLRTNKSRHLPFLKNFYSLVATNYYSLQNFLCRSTLLHQMFSCSVIKSFNKEGKKPTTQRSVPCIKFKGLKLSWRSGLKLLFNSLLCCSVINILFFSYIFMNQYKAFHRVILPIRSPPAEYFKSKNWAAKQNIVKSGEVFIWQSPMWIITLFFFQHNKSQCLVLVRCMGSMWKGRRHPTCFSSDLTQRSLCSLVCTRIGRRWKYRNSPASCGHTCRVHSHTHSPLGKY